MAESPRDRSWIRARPAVARADTASPGISSTRFRALVPAFRLAAQLDEAAAHAGDGPVLLRDALEEVVDPREAGVPRLQQVVEALLRPGLERVDALLNGGALVPPRLRSGRGLLQLLAVASGMASLRTGVLTQVAMTRRVNRALMGHPAGDQALVAPRRGEPGRAAGHSKRAMSGT